MVCHQVCFFFFVVVVVVVHIFRQASTKIHGDWFKVGLFFVLWFLFGLLVGFDK